MVEVYSEVKRTKPIMITTHPDDAAKLAMIKYTGEARLIAADIRREQDAKHR